jgi:hypothetical protein
MYADDGARRLRAHPRPAVPQALGAAVLLATVVAALATEGRHRAITLIVLFGGLTVAGCLFGLHIRNQLVETRAKQERTDKGTDVRG